MKTEPIYLDDPYRKEMVGRIIDVIPEKEGVWRLILDKTVFYPMGGGQPTDQGTFLFPDGSQGEVYQVLLTGLLTSCGLRPTTCQKSNKK